MIIYAMDIGGSSIKQSLIESTSTSNKIIRRMETAYHRTNEFDDLKFLVISLIGNTIKENKDLDVVAISTTGGVDRNGIVMSSGFFNGYANVSWEKIIKKSYTKIKYVHTMNDGRASAWAEYMNSNEKPETFVHFVLGTGIGGSSIVDGKLLKGDFGAAGYLGHIKVSSTSSTICSCGRTGCVETLASGPAIVRKFDELQNEDTQCKKFDLSDIVELCSNGDSNAISSVIYAAKNLGIAISDIMNIFNPGVVTIGGGVILALDNFGVDTFLPCVIDSAKSNAHKKTLSTNIRLAMLGNDAGMLGASAAAYENIRR